MLGECPVSWLGIHSHAMLWEGEEALSEARGDPAQALGCCDNFDHFLRQELEVYCVRCVFII